MSGVPNSEAPVFRPSREDFKHPFEYFESIREAAEPYGICRVIPPPCWKPPFSLDLTTFCFPTRIQYIHQLYKRSSADGGGDNWWESYVAFQLAIGKKQRTRNPILGGKELELKKLYDVVEKFGGYMTVCREKLWKEVARKLQVHLANGNTTYSLRNVYEKYLKDFEDHKAGVYTGTEPVEVDDHELNRLKQEKKDEASLRKRRRSVRRTPGNLEALLCEHCGGGQFENCMILCDNCPTHRTKGYHTFCCSPPCESIPEGNFYCPECSSMLFGREVFVTGQNTTYTQFKSRAEAFEASYGTNTVTHEDIEADFWRIVENGDEEVAVLYGADIQTGTYGSGFPTSSANSYSYHPMNLNNLPRSSDSLLSLISEDIPGVIVPWLYVGMKYSVFCWHVEDHLFYSINYLHKGAGKKWYGISSHQADEFETLLRNNILKDQLKEQPDLMFHITTMVAPARLREHGISVCETIQEEGEFVLTFPNAYHSGFNMGLNIAEAVNFAPMSWLRFRRRAHMRYINHRRPQVLSTDELLLKAAQKEDGIFRGEDLYREIDSLTQEEELNRLSLWIQGVVKSMKISSSHGLKAGDMEDICCIICRDYLHVSAVVCSCCHRPVCVRHVNQQCECPMSSRTLLYRYTLAQLRDIRDKACESQIMEIDEKLCGLKRDLDSEARENPGLSKFHSFLNQWKCQAEEVLGSTEISSPDMDSLLYEAMQFLWAGHEVDEHRELFAKIKASIEWNNGIERLFLGSESKVSVEELKDLFDKSPNPVGHPSMIRLKEMIKDVQEWTLEAQQVLHPSEDIELRRIVEFYEKGNLMNVLLPGLNLVKERVSDAKALQSTVQDVFKDLGKLHEVEDLEALVQRAKDLRIKFDERMKLEEFLGNLSEWKIKANSNLDKTLGLQELRELISETHGAWANVSELQVLRRRLKEAEEWDEEAKRATKHSESIAEISSILDRGRSFNVIFPEMERYEMKLAQLEWIKRTTEEMKNQPLKSNTLDRFLREGVECKAEETTLFQDLLLQKIKSDEWRSKVREVMKRIKSADAQVNFRELQELHSDPIATSTLLAEAAEFDEVYQRIQPMAAIIESTMAAMLGGQSLKSWEVAPVVAQAENEGITFDDLPELKRRIALAEDFSSQANEMLTVGLQLSHLPRLKDLLQLGEEFVSNNGFRIAEMDILLEWDTRLRLEWLMHRLLCDPDEDNQTDSLGLPLDTVPFSPLEILKHRFSEAVQRQGTQATPNRDERPQLDAVSAVLEQAKCVNSNYQLIGRLERAYGGGLKWKEYVDETIHGSRKLKPMEITNLLQLGKDSAFKLDGIEHLETMLQAYNQWTEEAQKVLDSLEKSRLPLEDVQKLLTEIQKSSVLPEGETADKLKGIVQPALDLRDSLQKKLHGSLETLYVSVHKVAGVVQRTDWKQSGINGCYCGQTQGLDPLLNCAKCSHWYHASCIPSGAKSSRRWLCCACKNSAHRSEKPSAQTLQNHLEAYRLLKVSLTEERMLEAVLHHYQLWYCRVTDMLSRHEASQTKSGEDCPVPLDVSELACIWKQSLTIGVHCKDVLDRAARATKAAQCRALLVEHLEESGLTTFDIPRCRKEEIPLHIVDKKPQVEIVRTFIENSVESDDPTTMDPLVGKAKAALAAVYKWEAECQELTMLLDRHAGQSIERVPAELLRRTSDHIDKATTIRVQVSREALEHLIFQSTPYCICRQTNDSERPMLACEEEEDCPILWFHHRCVGLSESDQPPPGYRCPHCHMRRGDRYPYPLPHGSAVELNRQFSNFASQRPTLPVPDVRGNMVGQSEVGHQVKMNGADIASLFSDISSRWSQWSDIERLRVLEHVGECVREESRRIHEQQQRNILR